MSVICASRNHAVSKIKYLVLSLRTDFKYILIHTGSIRNNALYDLTTSVLHLPTLLTDSPLFCVDVVQHLVWHPWQCGSYCQITYWATWLSSRMLLQHTFGWNTVLSFKSFLYYPSQVSVDDFTGSFIQPTMNHTNYSCFLVTYETLRHVVKESTSTDRSDQSHLKVAFCQDRRCGF
jgi:hypothetical protein